eukprot:CAMPEP_0174365406 /NCGR_PEP_ID=MMETSP0811_2-20130205/77138_1 /TAXON_ID=73025 ORGANISM="Eutreptiella gymnastica-like, Strain CCMP1594" /NCGR_SAMPLE_ID=MMETSP0811_2 /ASSEMBLY_ACC=CAM_ASM_000667 /LENGTH=77 /DNA_ID=CAMNT_0015506035 /DNA_START=80 /DNA_END=313 /DNA_ORIENTATION=-
MHPHPFEPSLTATPSKHTTGPVKFDPAELSPHGIPPILYLKNHKMCVLPKHAPCQYLKRGNVYSRWCTTLIKTEYGD